ncbi:TGF-beta-activated kinase 1 and MAP3K7-binding protein 2 isoform X2 [Petromyzon marinus]|uniref:TGF-beta-activated kinase 1 and MAP3K7-binding protein 2 isoform X2 n=1 Tax=Petromyzon marinus TaxID=7757 RepID=UPI003F72E561
MTCFVVHVEFSKSKLDTRPQNQNNRDACAEALAQASNKYLDRDSEETGVLGGGGGGGGGGSIGGGGGIAGSPLHTHTIHLNVGNGSSHIWLHNNPCNTGVPAPLSGTSVLGELPSQPMGRRDSAGGLHAYPIYAVTGLSQQQPQSIKVTLKPNMQTGRGTPTSLHIRGGLNQQPAQQQQQQQQMMQQTQQQQPPLYMQSSKQPSLYSIPTVYSSIQQQSQQAQQQQQQQSQQPTVYSSSQQHQTSHVYMPVSSPTSVSAHVQFAQPQSQLGYLNCGPNGLSSSACAGPTSLPAQSPGVSAACPSPASAVPTATRKNQIEIKIEQPHLHWGSTGGVRNAAPSLVSHGHGMGPGPGGGRGMGQPTLLIATSPASPSTNSTAVTVGGRTSSGSSCTDTQAGSCVQPTLIRHQPPRSRPTSITTAPASPAPARVIVTQPNTKYTFEITVSPNKPPAISPGVASPTYEGMGILDRLGNSNGGGGAGGAAAGAAADPSAPAPASSTSAQPGASAAVTQPSLAEAAALGMGGAVGLAGAGPPQAGAASVVPDYQGRESYGSDDQAYTQALMLHQRMRMDRLQEALGVERGSLETLKAEVNEMENVLNQRRLRRASSSMHSPSLDDMSKLRQKNRQLQIDIDCMTKEFDLCQARGKNFNPDTTLSFYKNLGYQGQVGPVPPKASTQDSLSTLEREARKISVTAKLKGAQTPDSPVIKAEDQRETDRPAGSAARDEEEEEGSAWSCITCTFLNHPALNHCEECDMPRHY